MEKKKYICLNFGGCNNADAQPPIDFEIPEGEELLCPECGKHNVRLSVTKPPINLGKIAKIVGLMLGLGVLGYFLYDYLGDKPKEKKDVATTISTKTEQPKVKQSQENVKVDSIKLDVKPEPVEEKEKKEKVIDPDKTKKYPKV